MSEGSPIRDIGSKILSGILSPSQERQAVAQTQVAVRAGLNYELAPNYGTVQLRQGFEPDPWTLNVDSGGEANAESLGGECVGTATAAPDVRLQYSTNGSSRLTIAATSDGDVGLVINLPDGRWICDDDSGGDLDPMVQLSSARAGQYDIWVSTVDGDDESATLLITEREDF